MKVVVYGKFGVVNCLSDKLGCYMPFESLIDKEVVWLCVEVVNRWLSRMGF